LGWRLDYKKFRLYLKNKYGVEKAFLFIGMVEGNQSLYTELQTAGFILVFKPTVRYFENGKETVKGNVDAELVLHASAIEYDNYEKAVIVSGDGDFACLVEYLVKKEKLLKLIAPSAKYSQLLSQFDAYIICIDKLIVSFGKKAPDKTKDRDKRSVETLGSLGHDDKESIGKKDAKVNSSRLSRFMRRPKST
jgi:uncharacterized LabA/DUF88 family protein